MYGQHLYLFSDNNLFCNNEVVAITIAKYEKKIVDLQNAWSIVNKVLLKKISRLKKFMKNKSRKKEKNLHLLVNGYSYHIKKNINWSQNNGAI